MATMVDKADPVADLRKDDDASPRTRDKVIQDARREGLPDDPAETGAPVQNKHPFRPQGG